MTHDEQNRKIAEWCPEGDKHDWPVTNMLTGLPVPGWICWRCALRSDEFLRRLAALALIEKEQK